MTKQMNSAYSFLSVEKLPVFSPGSQVVVRLKTEQLWNPYENQTSSASSTFWAKMFKS